MSVAIQRDFRHSVSTPSSSTNKSSGSSMTRETTEGDLGTKELLADVRMKEGRVAVLCNTGQLFRSSKDVGVFA